MVDARSVEEAVRAGESYTVEFKGERQGRISDQELVEAAVCLANGRGGLLLVGVEDDGTVTGALPRHEAGVTDTARVEALVANRTRPSISVKVSEVAVGGRPVLVVEVPESNIPVGTSDGRYVRRGMGGDGRPACLPFQYHEMQARATGLGMQDPSLMPVPSARWEDLDPLEFERFRRLVRESGGMGDSSLVGLSDLELAKSLGAVDANHEVRSVRLLGLLLFGRGEALRRLVPTHEAALQVLSGTEVEVNDFYRWPLLRTVEEALARFRARNREVELNVGGQRIGVPDHSERGFREALANALTHRDYTMLGAVHVQWKDERIEISDPGGFPEGVHIHNLLVTPPRPRNPLLADAFKRAGLVERTGRGIDTIYEFQLRNGRRPPSYDRSDRTTVVVSIEGVRSNLDFVRLVVERAQAGRRLTLEELIVLYKLWHDRELKTKDAAELLQRPLDEARAVLERLVEDGPVEGRGSAKGRVYHLSATTYRRLGTKAAYVRRRGFEPLQQEQMVIQYVRKHGSISRKEAADLCSLTLPQAYGLIMRLVGEGRLQRSPGTARGRGVKYEQKAT